MSSERFRAFLNKHGDGRCFRLRDKTINGTLFWLTESEAYQLRDALSDAIDVHEEKRYAQATFKDRP
ncbi:hypothetical protein [Prescottella agglutinans]|uniref:Uncharacterized protein n=1 Tax=Prescottella agglutinans TaxID=1644129 RepID=A0ABT6M9K3_9NOCA|nr:hypothetical protein [Prescottella agglutinans]MDH6280981.1 hypothetical protein [Prescottella agglutinans]